MAGTSTTTAAAAALRPVVLLYGEEAGLAAQRLQQIREAVVPAGLEAFAHERFDGAACQDESGVLASCRQMPMMVARRLVELRDPQLIGGGGDAASAAAASLLEYAQAPSETTVLVIHAPGIDGRSKLVTGLSKLKATASVEKLEAPRRDEDAVAFVTSSAAQHGLTLGRGVADAIVERAGTGVAPLLGALELAALHAGAGATISLGDVEAVVPKTREAVVFDLTAAVGAGDLPRALAVCEELFAGQRDAAGVALPLVSLLARSLRHIALALAYPREIAARAGVPPFVAQRIADEARGWTRPRHRAVLAALVRLDLDLKGGSGAITRDAKLGVQRFILEACGAAGASVSGAVLPPRVR